MFTRSKENEKGTYINMIAPQNTVMRELVDPEPRSANSISCRSRGFKFECR
jgi:hypothetical protein